MTRTQDGIAEVILRGLYEVRDEPTLTDLGALAASRGVSDRNGVIRAARFLSDEGLIDCLAVLPGPLFVGVISPRGVRLVERARAGDPALAGLDPTPAPTPIPPAERADGSGVGVHIHGPVTGSNIAVNAQGVRQSADGGGGRRGPDRPPGTVWAWLWAKVRAALGV